MAAAREWDLEPHNTIVVLDGGKSEDELLAILDQLTWWCHVNHHSDRYLENDEVVFFREPDLDDEMTGFATKPGYVSSVIDSLPLLFGKGVNENG